jgi:hypothetical protein
VSKIRPVNDDKWKFNVLEREAFYDINWLHMEGLITNNLSLSEYTYRKEVNFGYHFWGKVFFANKQPVARNSLLGHALQSTCRPRIMTCAPLVG